MNDRKYKRLYKMLEGVTPLRADCGEVCGKSCCKGDENTGMLLFPGEKTSLAVKEKNGFRLAVCAGRCDREQRPLSCRIFPFFPVMTESGKIEAALDLRGYGICPLIEHSGEIKFDRRFLRAVRRAGRVLYRDEDTRAFAEKLSEEIRAQGELLERLGRATCSRPKADS